MMKDGLKSEGSAPSAEALKTGFVNDMCDYWKTVMAEIATGKSANEENLFEDISKLFGGKS